jgi:hypothetical protein
MTRRHRCPTCSLPASLFRVIMPPPLCRAAAAVNAAIAKATEGA